MIHSTAIKSKYDKHHLIGLRDLAEIDWYLQHLWDDGFKTVVEIPRKKHLKISAKKHKYWCKVNGKRQPKSNLMPCYPLSLINLGVQ